MLRKLLAKDRHFSPDNVWKYLVLGLHVNRSFDITVVLAYKCNLLLQLF